MTVIPRYGQFLSELAARFTRGGEGAEAQTPLDAEEAAQTLLARSGEVKSLVLARHLLDHLLSLDDAALAATARQMTLSLGPDVTALREALETLDLDDPASVRALHAAGEPRTQDLLRRLNQAPRGTSALVNLRARLLRLSQGDATLRALDGDFFHLFSSWFNRGFLDLRRINWDTSAEILERIIRYEAVHEISDWSELKRRVWDQDRRLYAFFHPALQDDPLIFVEVALTRSTPGSITSVLGPDREKLTPADATTAVFYSISNCQPGLRGISFGNFLIKQVVEDIHREWPQIETYVTLSPVPGLANWLGKESSAAEAPASIKEAVAALRGGTGTSDVAAVAAYYLTQAKRRNTQPVDSVARFHLGNGAELEAVHADADPSPRGMANAFGVMVNYRYHAKDIETNQEAFAATGDVKMSGAVRDLLRKGGARNV